MPRKKFSLKPATASHKKSPAVQVYREVGAVKKKWKNQLPVALVYPNTYSVGMSNLGYQLVYNLLNNIPSIVAERIFLPESSNQPKSIESKRLLADFPVILFSVSFEEDYLRLIQILSAGEIPPLAIERKGPEETSETVVGPRSAGYQPIIIAGGVATMINPEPLAPFIDMFIIGEAEPILQKIMELLLSELHYRSQQQTKDSLLKKLASRFPCCYVPSFYTDLFEPESKLSSISATHNLPIKIKKSTLLSPAAEAGHSQILTPDAEFSNLYMTELGRGCTRGCRFCAAGFIYRPPRLWDSDAIIKAFRKRPENSCRIGLLGMEMATPENLKKITEYLLKESCSLSFSSLRADVLNAQLLNLLAKSGLKTAAIAPDGSSERLRRVINKGINEKDLLQAAELLVHAGVKNLKLYFMIGLPTETDKDIKELITITNKIKEKILPIGRARGSLSTLSLSINCFIPKPWTPFQFHPFEKVSILKNRISFIRKQLKGQANIKIKAEKPDNAFFQAVLARGDRNVGKVLHTLAITKMNWKQGFKKHNLLPENYAMRQRDLNEIFPWEILDHGIDRKYLWAEYKRALKGKITPPCITERCKRCGVCSGEEA